MSKIVMFLIGCALLCLIPTHNAHAATFSVCTFAELESAIITANSNAQADVINFNCTTTLMFTTELIILNDGAGNGITINGNAMILDGGDSTRHFIVNAGASLTLNNMTLQNGFASSYGSIFNAGTLTINNSTFADNTVLQFGAAIYNDAGTLVISNSTFTNNSGGGGTIYNDFGTLSISNSTLTNNSAMVTGGVMYNLGGTTTSTDNTYTNNLADFGGAIYNNGVLNITNDRFITNSAIGGGAILSSDFGTTTITNGVFTGNSATDDGGAIANSLSLTIINSIFTDNVAGSGTSGAIITLDTISSTNTHYGNNTCLGSITNNGGNTVTNATGCPGSAPIPLDVSAIACVGDDAVFTINNGDGNFNITGTGAGLDILDSPAGLITLTGPATWANIRVTERRGERQFVPLGEISCPEGVIIPPPPPTPIAPMVILSPDLTALGCELTSNIDLANAPDDTYCRILMKNGAVINYSGAVPADLISLGVIFAVDVYRLEGGRSLTEFPNYARVCLAGQGRLFYMDSRNAPRVSIELATETEGSLTCGWIPAPGTLILTN